VKAQNNLILLHSMMPLVFFQGLIKTILFNELNKVINFLVMSRFNFLHRTLPQSFLMKSQKRVLSFKLRVHAKIRAV